MKHFFMWHKVLQLRRKSWFLAATCSQSTDCMCVAGKFSHVIFEEVDGFARLNVDEPRAERELHRIAVRTNQEDEVLVVSVSPVDHLDP